MNAVGTRATERAGAWSDTAAVHIAFEPATDTLVTATPPGTSPDTLLAAVRNAALARRVALEAGGVPTGLLASGDSSIRAADSLEAMGRLTEAVLALSAANTRWADAEREHERREAERAAQRRRAARPRPTPITQPQRAIPDTAIAAPRPPEPNRRSSDTAAIGSIVARLERALESRRIENVRDVYPALTPKEERTWQSFFDVARELQMTLTIHELQTFGESANAVVRGSYTFVTSSGEQRAPIEFPAVFGREGGSWRLRHLGRTGS